MTLLAVERIKLFTTRSPWWCMLLALVLTMGFSVLVTVNSSDAFPATVGHSESGYQFGLIVIMVLAALAATNEYRFGTIRTSFQAVPNRSALLTAKVVVVALLAGVVGEVTAFASWGVARLIKPGTLMNLDSAQEWRNVAGIGLVYLIAAVIAVSVGILLRQTAGAVTVLLVYTLLAESLVSFIPKIGTKIQEWMPFNNASNFLNAGAAEGAQEAAARGATHMPLGPWASVAYFAGFAVVLLIAALVTANRRDA